MDKAIDLVVMSKKISSTAPSAAESSVSMSDTALHHEVPDPGEDDLDDLDGNYV